MNRNELIEDILRLTPASAERQARARPLLTDMADDALRRTHEDLAHLDLEGAEIISRMAPGVSNPFARGDQILAASLGKARKTLDAVSARIRARSAHGTSRSHDDLDAVQTGNQLHVADLKTLESSIGRWKVPVAVQEVTSVIERAVQAHEWEGPFRQAGVPDATLQDALDTQRVLETARQSLAIPLGHEFLYRNRSEWATLDERQTIDALARVENDIAQSAPDLIVAMNPEGRAISELIIQDLGLRIPVAMIQGEQNHLEWRDSGFGSGIQRICIIGHVAWSGVTIDEVIAITRARFQADTVSVAVLAATATAVERIGGLVNFAFHCVTTAQKVFLGIRPDALRLAGDGFAFPSVVPGHDDVVIPASILRKTRELMGRQYVAGRFSHQR